jgi:hypothetical protein
MGVLMRLLQKAALVAAVVVVVLSSVALIRGEFRDAAIGAFVSICALITSGIMVSIRSSWKRRKTRRPVAVGERFPKRRPRR